MSLPPVLRISTRGSRLALWQAKHVASLLGHPTELCVVKSQGDRIKDQALQGRDDQGFFTREIQEAVLRGEAELAVHSLKDLPTGPTPGLALAAVPVRETVEDVLLVHPDSHDLARAIPVREGGAVGATSLRRQALLRHFSPDLMPKMLRGNVPTRLERLKKGEFAAILLARAGLRRLGLRVEGFLAYALDPRRWIPAPGQAALGVETAQAGEVMAHVRDRLDHAESRRAVELERALMARFEAGCHAAFGAWARSEANELAVCIGCGTQEGGWAEAAITAESPEAAMEAAWEALTRARTRGAAPGAAAGVTASAKLRQAPNAPSPCTAIEAF
ncbi:MAG: hydroxymethylbilane synthase [Polyangia bacterium]|jgi:hydroxymethylbilane synthase|nr:hydroxymethylbilane synthase [Polyangia bacterium]